MFLWEKVILEYKLSHFSFNKRKFIWKVRGGRSEEVSCRRNGLGKRVTEAEEGPVELRGGEGKGKVPGGEGRREGAGVLPGAKRSHFLKFKWTLVSKSVFTDLSHFQILFQSFPKIRKWS